MSPGWRTEGGTSRRSFGGIAASDGSWRLPVCEQVRGKKDEGRGGKRKMSRNHHTGLMPIQQEPEALVALRGPA